MQFGVWKKRLLGEANRLVNQFGPPIAVDFGVGSLKILQIADSDTPQLIAAACVPTPDDLVDDPGRRIQFQVDALPKLMRSVGFKGRRAVCGIPAPQAFCKHMQFQGEGGTSIATMVRSALPAQIGCDPSALVYRHIDVGPVGRGNKNEVICMAASRDLVERLMRGLKDAKLEPVGMHIEFMATLRAFDSITRRIEDARVTSLYLDIGGGSTKVTIAHGRDLVFARMVDVGGYHLDQVVARQLKLELPAARTLRLQMAELVPTPSPAPVAAAAVSADGAPGAETAVMEDRRIGEAPTGHTPDLAGGSTIGFEPGRADLSEPLEMLTDEISMCLRYHDSVFPDRRIDRAIFIGGEARHVGLCQHVARTLRLPAQVADPMAGVARTGKEPTIGVDFRSSQPGWAMALGLSLCPTDL
jgi:type IV pilus assembly protein PilM